MAKKYVEGLTFSQINFTETPLELGEYENCTFQQCMFGGQDLSHFIFADCLFDESDLSNCKVTNTTLRDVSFDNCKLLGLRFEDCNTFLLSMNFSHCVLNFSSFYKLKLKSAQFQHCSLHEVDFTEVELNDSDFQHADLTGAVFSRSNLTGVDFRGASNIVLDPEENKLQKAKFNRDNVFGLLTKYGIKIE